MPYYPTAIPTDENYPDRSDDVDWIYAARYNEIKNEVLAALAELGISPSGSSDTLAERLTLLALKSNVLELDNTTPFTPDADYEPATKKYVDDSTPSGLAAMKLNILLNAFRIAVNGSLVKYNLVDGIMDEFEDESGVDTETSENETYDSETASYSPSTGGTIDQQQTVGAAGFGGPGDNSGSEREVAQSFALSATLTVTKIAVSFSANIGSPTGNVTCRIETDSAGKPSGNLAHENATASSSITPSEWNDFTFAESFSLAGSTTYWIRLSCPPQDENQAYNALNDNQQNLYADGIGKYSDDGGATWQDYGTGSDLAFKVYVASIQNMTLISTATEAESQPDEVRIVIMEEDVDAITPNTDLKAYASRDNGANWVQITLADEGDYQSGQRILSGSADISGQAADQTMKWKIETLNDKNCKLHGIGELWN